MTMELTHNVSKRNIQSLLWHAAFLAIAQNFMDVDTVIPSMMVDAGGTAVHIGILTAIMLGGSSFTQLIFAPFISNYNFKKKFLLLGINSRVLSLAALGLMLFFAIRMQGSFALLMIFFLITTFSLGGAFANISYTDIMGKAILPTSRKTFLSIKKVVSSLLLIASVFAARYVLSLQEYPHNYSLMFFFGSGALLVASFGFWNIREEVPSKLSIKGFRNFFQIIKSELRRNPRLGYFLGMINTMGISIALLPFIVLYAKEHALLESSDTGNFLLFKVLGSVMIGLLLFALKGKYRYNWLMYFNGVMVILIPVTLLLFPQIQWFIPLFFIGGIVVASYSITLNGVLLEISDNKNRALYTGIVGAGNILPAIFPLLGGWMISQYGYELFFFSFILIILSSLFFIIKIKCRH